MATNDDVVEDQVDDDTEVEIDGDDEDGGDGGEETVEQLRERLAKADAALKKANKQAERLRRTRSGQGKRPESDGEGRKEADASSDMRVKRLAGIAALAGEGLTRAQAKIAVRLLDLDDVEVDDDGDGDFDDAIAELKESFPGLFRKDDDDDRDVRPARRQVARLTTGDKGRSAGRKALTPSEIQARALVGG